MNDKNQNAESVAIIGGADGPTSILITGKGGKKPLKLRVRDYIHKQKRKRVEKSIRAGAHSLEQVAAYARQKYGAAQTDQEQSEFIQQRKALKESLVLRYKPELLGITDEAAFCDYFRQQDRHEQVAKIPDSEMPMDYRVYEIIRGDSRLEIEIEYVWNVFGVSCSGGRKAMKQFKKIVRDLYLYYGVSEQDIGRKTERYASLLSVLSS